jgi:CelD/BcsL family acetyltransferase involved in cellulose biosynthesis
MLDLEIVQDLARLHEVTAEWSVFARSIESTTPFQLPEWLMTWWRHFGSGTPYVMIFRTGGKMVAIVPCFLHTWNEKRQMTLIGSGISDYLEPLIDRAYTEDVLVALERNLAANSNWDVCDWQDLSDDTPLRRLHFENGVNVLEREDVPCSQIRLTGTFEEFWALRSPDLRRNVRRYTQRAILGGPLRFIETNEANPELLDALIDLHGERWARRGEPGMIQANRSEAFLREIAAEFATRDMLRLFAVRYRGRIAAVVLAFLYANQIFSYLSAFDPEFESLSLARNLLYQSIRHCFERNCRSWDFLRGEEPYKFSWGAERIPKRRITLTR